MASSRGRSVSSGKHKNRVFNQPRCEDRDCKILNSKTNKNSARSCNKANFGRRSSHEENATLNRPAQKGMLILILSLTAHSDIVGIVVLHTRGEKERHGIEMREEQEQAVVLHRTNR